MTTLDDAVILYLDDLGDNLLDAKSSFESEGFGLQITDSISEAKNRAIQGDIDILICDLRLDKISKSENGKKILRHIRERNKDVFLALYTAYQKELTQNEIKLLTENKIRIYDKNTHEELMLNLQNDYNNFVTEKRVKKQETPDFDIITEIKQDVLLHLRNITNHEMNVPIPGVAEITVKDLIQEVKNDSDVGKKYMKEWYKTLMVIQYLRKKR
ncbi:MAG TPA: hypothetical protein VLJ68_08050 [Chitinophagaceae bacterium]|nr:hypothetical protein [Chitinophagaceae bacterium]